MARCYFMPLRKIWEEWMKEWHTLGLINIFLESFDNFIIPLILKRNFYPPTNSGNGLYTPLRYLKYSFHEYLSSQTMGPWTHVAAPILSTSINFELLNALSEDHSKICFHLDYVLLAYFTLYLTFQGCKAQMTALLHIGITIFWDSLSFL